MDFSKFYHITRDYLVASGIDLHYLDRNDILYYDESGNDKHLVVKERKLNSDFSQVFVLGGIQSEDVITLDELKIQMGKAQTNELKANNYLKGSFNDILFKDNMRSILELIIEKNWHVHFIAIQVLYYGFVDIVDSINGLESDPFEFKAILYEVLKRDPDRTVLHFMKYKYPNIKDNSKNEFLDGILEMINQRINDDLLQGKFYPMVLVLRDCISKAKSQKTLEFVQNEDTHVWVSNFVQFYRQEILIFKNKTLVFDEEIQVQNLLKDETLIIDSKKICNYSFTDSSSNAMIQVSDYVASILRKYFIFLDRTQDVVEKDIAGFNDVQIRNFKLMNYVLKNSLTYNPLFVHFIASAHMIKKFHKYLSVYGVSKL